MNFQEYEATKIILDEVLARLTEIDQRLNQCQHQQLTNQTDFPTTNRFEYDTEPPLDDYRKLPIIPSLEEILSDTRTYLRPNIINGTYENPQQYLSVSKN